MVPDKSALALYPVIPKQIEVGSEVFTDEHPAYIALDRSGFVHNSIRHNEGVYVSGNVHTQTIENFWSLVKRGISGVYHAVSPQHLQGYLDEYVWRYNHRDDDAAMFLNLILSATRP